MYESTYFFMLMWYNIFGDIVRKITLNKIEYEVIKDDDDSIDVDLLISLMTEYFEPFDYILGDYSYNKLRLKGFYDDKNKAANKINKYSLIDEHIREYCAFNCKYFIIKKVSGGVKWKKGLKN